MTISTSFSNLTDSSRLLKVDPNTNFPRAVEVAQKKQTAFESRLKNDPTKNSAAKDRLRFKNALGLVAGLMTNLDGQATARQATDSEYKGRVTSWLDQTGTTNLLILNSTYEVMRGWSVSKLMKASRDDRNVSKMILTTPAGRYGYELSDTQRQHFFGDAVKHTLGDDVADFENNKNILDALTIAGENLLSHHNELHSAMSNIDARVVEVA